MTSSCYLLAAASDTLRVWDTPSAPLNTSAATSEHQQPRPVFSVKGATSEPRLTCWNGAFDTLATLYRSSQIVTHDTSGALVEEVNLEGENVVREFPAPIYMYLK